MVETETRITTRYGAMPTFTAHPAGAGPWPAVILLMDAPGIREELRNHARRIAKQGYYCLLPDLYYRLGLLRFDLPRRDEAMSALVGAAFRSITDTAIRDDCAGVLSFIDAQDAAASGAVGAVGYCMSGRGVLVAAAAFPQRIKAAASLYGVRLVTDAPDSPHLHLGGIEAELYLAFGERDNASPQEQVDQLRTALAEAGRVFQLDVFAAADHGFMFAEGKNYAPTASEQAWTRVLDLLARKLG
ncbi:MAG: dienelactone hydrolase family protein [Burkholderiales bacterium]|nr:dienelactone hydrolase family protein [Burkholderiales bacterium]